MCRCLFLIDDLTLCGRNAVRLKNVHGQIQAYSLYFDWVARFPAVDSNCNLARSVQAEQELSTSSAKGRARNFANCLWVEESDSVPDQLVFATMTALVNPAFCIHGTKVSHRKSHVAYAPCFQVSGQYPPF